jgi:hypothetical protein
LECSESMCPIEPTDHCSRRDRGAAVVVGVVHSDSKVLAVGAVIAPTGRKVEVEVELPYVLSRSRRCKGNVGGSRSVRVWQATCCALE